jgi:hypothetical protein
MVAAAAPAAAFTFAPITQCPMNWPQQIPSCLILLAARQKIPPFPLTTCIPQRW